MPKKARWEARSEIMRREICCSPVAPTTPTVQTWLEQFAQTYAQKPEPEGRAVVIELDEMWHYLKKSQSRCGSGRLGIVLQGSWWTGNAAVVTRPPVNACLSA